jgi:hypothetical protein
MGEASLLDPETAECPFLPLALFSTGFNSVLQDKPHFPIILITFLSGSSEFLN